MAPLLTGRASLSMSVIPLARSPCLVPHHCYNYLDASLDLAPGEYHLRPLLVRTIKGLSWPLWMGWKRHEDDGWMGLENRGYRGLWGRANGRELTGGWRKEEGNKCESDCAPSGVRNLVLGSIPSKHSRSDSYRKVWNPIPSLKLQSSLHVNRTHCPDLHPLNLIHRRHYHPHPLFLCLLFWLLVPHWLSYYMIV